ASCHGLRGGEPAGARSAAEGVAAATAADSAGGCANVQVLQMAPPDCQLCEDTVATLFCKQCQENFCQEVACSLPLQACSSCVHQLPLRSPLPAIIICAQHTDALFLRSASMRSTILGSARGTKFCRWRRAPRAALKSRKQQ
ncbi:MAG: hypothetical protein ACPIOQ_62910, partial [Promethearchaeia archaeon]